VHLSAAGPSAADGASSCHGRQECSWICLVLICGRANTASPSDSPARSYCVEGTPVVVVAGGPRLDGFGEEIEQCESVTPEDSRFRSRRTPCHALPSDRRPPNRPLARRSGWAGPSRQPGPSRNNGRSGLPHSAPSCIFLGTLGSPAPPSWTLGGPGPHQRESPAPQ
jgi:hypothetical protein